MSRCKNAKNASACQSGGSFVSNLADLAVPFGIILAQKGLSYLTSGSKPSKPTRRGSRGARTRAAKQTKKAQAGGANNNKSCELCKQAKNLKTGGNNTNTTNGAASKQLQSDIQKEFNMLAKQLRAILDNTKNI